MQLTEYEQVHDGTSVCGTRTRTSDETGAERYVERDEVARTVTTGHRGFDGQWILEAREQDRFGRTRFVSRPGEDAPSVYGVNGEPHTLKQAIQGLTSRGARGRLRSA